jgi:hypothetical protein
MLYYPKIPGSRNCPDGQCIAFEKYDGTNLHWDWDRDFGWHAFGTRRDVFNLTDVGIKEFQAKHQHLSNCVAVFQHDWAIELERVFKNNLYYQDLQEIKVFGEFLGENSNAYMSKLKQAFADRWEDYWE